jgi:hypothetical protein
MRTHGQCRPGLLREQLTHFSAHAFPPAFVKGFVDAIDAYVSMSLGRRGKCWPPWSGGWPRYNNN